MSTQFKIVATTPNGTDMAVSYHGTREAAEAALIERRAKYPHWDFVIQQVHIDD